MSLYTDRLESAGCSLVRLPLCVCATDVQCDGGGEDVGVLRCDECEKGREVEKCVDMCEV